MRSALIGFVALGLMAGAVSAQDKMDCSKEYKGFWDKLERGKYAKISPEQLAGVSRMALRAYDACQAGDELDAKALFARLAPWGDEMGPLDPPSPGPFNPNLPG